MRWIKSLLVITLALLVILIGILLSINNQQLVVVDLVFVQLPEASVARWLILSFILGSVLSFSVSFLAILALKVRLKQAKRQIRNSSKELDALRVRSLTDSC